MKKKYSRLLNGKQQELNKKESKALIQNITCDYFLQDLFEFLTQKKSLDIVKYNNNMKKRIEIHINDYKEYSQNYSSIEIEIIPANNKYGRFINYKKEEEIYYHIYFNNNKEEIKRNYLSRVDKVKTINIMIDYHVKSFRNLFDKCECIESINFKIFNRDNINNMSGMFYRCSSLKEIKFSNFNPVNVVDMAGMFSYCTSLEKLDLSNFNTNKLTNMWCMFSDCASLKEVNLSNFNTNKVTNMGFMFSRCPALEELNLDNFSINSSINTKGIFYGCSKEFIKKIKTQYKDIKEIAFINIF